MSPSTATIKLVPMLVLVGRPSNEEAKSCGHLNRRSPEKMD